MREIKQFSDVVFRQLCDEHESAMIRFFNSSKELREARLNMLKMAFPNDNEENLCWRLCAMECVDNVDDLLAFLARKGAMSELMTSNQYPTFIVKNERGWGIHPAIYAAAAIAEMVVDENSKRAFDKDSFQDVLDYYVSKFGISADK